MIKTAWVGGFDSPPIAILPSDGGFFVQTDNNKIYQLVNGECKSVDDFVNIINKNGIDISCNYIALCDGNTNLFIFNLKDKSIVKCESVGEVLCNPRISPNESLIAAADDDHCCYVWNMETGEKCSKYEEHDEDINYIAFSVSGIEIFTAETRALHKWNVQDGKFITARHQNQIITGLAVSQTRVVLSTYNSVRDGYFYVFDDMLLYLYTLKGYGAVISPNGVHMAFVNPDKTIVLWDVAARKDVICFERESAIVSKICFSRDGHSLASISPDCSLVVYKNIPLYFFLQSHGLEINIMKSIHSFFHALIDSTDKLFPFNDNDHDNYLLMRILIHIK